MSIKDKIRNGVNWISEQYNLAIRIVENENEKKRNVQDFYKSKKKNAKLNNEI